MNIQDIVAAAIYDFAAHLTCLPKPMTVGSTHDAGPMAQTVDRFLKLRDVSVSHDPPIQTWQNDMRMMALEEQHRALNQPPQDVRQHITFAINAHGLDTQLGVPDFVLSDVAMAAMRSMALAHRATRYWDAENTPERVMQKSLFAQDKPQAERAMDRATLRLDIEASDTLPVVNPQSQWPFPTSRKVSDPQL